MAAMAGIKTNSKPTDAHVDPRRYDLDWLRIIAFGVLIFFHSAVLFLPKGIPNILNDESSPILGVLVAFFHQFRLGLLFLVSGMGVRFAMAKRQNRDYLLDRCRRLLIPLFFGITVVVPPMIYFEKVYNQEFEGSFWQFYPGFFSQGVYPAGNLSWHHYWFVAYLFLFCLLTIGLFRSWLSHNRQGLLNISSYLAQGYRLYLPVLPLFLNELILRPIFPGFRDLIGDWASFVHWLIIFVLGFVMASRLELVEKCKALRFLSLALAVTASIALFVLFFDFQASRFSFERDYTLINAARFISYSAIRTVSVWAWLLVSVGFAARYLNRHSNWVVYLNRSVYPVFCMHLTVIVTIAFWVLPTDYSIAVKYWAIALGSFLVVFALYHFVVQKMGWAGILLGWIKPGNGVEKDRL